MALYSRFFSTQKSDEPFNEICKKLVELSPDSKKLVLSLKDQEAEFCDNTAFAAFVTGFRVASGIAAELKDAHYSYDEEQEQRAEKQCNEMMERDT